MTDCASARTYVQTLQIGTQLNCAQTLIQKVYQYYSNFPRNLRVIQSFLCQNLQMALANLLVLETVYYDQARTITDWLVTHYPKMKQSEQCKFASLRHRVNNL